MFDGDFLDSIDKDFGLIRHWQWVYQVEGCPLWEITPMYMTKEKFLEFKTHYNEMHPRAKIMFFGKAKVTRRFFAAHVNE